VERPSENVWKLIEAFRAEGLAVAVLLRPDDAEEPRVTVAIQGHPRHHGDTLAEAVLEIGRSHYKKPSPPPPPPPPPQTPPGPFQGVRKRSRVVDIVDEVERIADSYTRPFRADEIADQMGVFGSAVGHALKRLDWPRDAHKTRAIIDGRPLDVYLYLPR